MSYPRLNIDEIHVWQVGLERDATSVRALLETLSPDENQRANKYHFANHRDRFIVARGTLRKILAAYLDIEPTRIAFSHNKFGKPVLDLENEMIHFNVSHSEDLALVAVTRRQEVGIDVEFINDDIEIRKSAESIFSPAEVTALKALPLESQRATFFEVWTRKEALLKALGRGFSYPPRQFTVLPSAEGSNISARTEEFHGIRGWSLVSLPSVQKYSAALAVKGDIGTIRYRRFS